MDQLLAGAFFGLILTVAVYHLLMFVVLRSPAFLSYGAYLLALAAFQFARTPFVPVGGFLTDTKALFWWTFAILTAFGYWLFRSFLALHEQQPRLNRVFVVLTALLVAISAAAPWRAGTPLAVPWFGGASYDVTVDRIAEGVALLVLIVAFAGLLGAFRHRVRVARYFGLAYAGLFAGAIARVVAESLPDVAYHDVLAHGIELGSAFQALTLALGIADRIAAANEERDRAQRRTIEEIRSLNVAYARFVPREFLVLLEKDDVRDVALGEGIEREMTVLFSDVRSFTSISESLTPKQTFGFINELLGYTGPAIREHGGIVDKYVGDAIMALFAHGSDDALLAAIALQRGVAAYNVQRAARGEQPVAVGVGMHHGTLMLGTIGEAARMDGTVIADAVNAASRVEGLTKRFGATIIISETVRDTLHNPAVYALRSLGRVAVEGKSRGLEIFEVLDGESPERREQKLAHAEAFDRAVRLFVRGNFLDAAPLFQEISFADPGDGAARYFEGRALDLAARRAKWDGVDSLAKDH